MRIFVINLDRSPERWRDVQRSASEAGLAVERVPAVDGNAVEPEERVDVDPERFRRWHGRRILPGEYGCYRSHLTALEAFRASGEAVGLICEDDVLLNADLAPAIEAALAARPGLHVLKLANHRVRGFVRHDRRAANAALGRCIHGPQGSAACYAVTHEGAAILLASLKTMWLPYDVALERGWATGASTYTLRRNIPDFGPTKGKSTITADRATKYKRSKYPVLRRIPVALFRGVDYLRRARYALG